MSTRPFDSLRPTTIEPCETSAPGSVLITQGRTRVLCTASLSDDVPPWLIDRESGVARRGWVTAEYSMLPGSTPDRKKRGADGRSAEIQRLIARALRAAVDLDAMPGLVVTCDCDVLLADGGTRAASVTGAFVALANALEHARAQGRVARDPLRGAVAAVSVGIVDERAQLDLDYALDVRAAVDLNVVMNHLGELVEVQATGESATFVRARLDEMLDLAERGIRELMAIQRRALEERTPARVARGPAR